MYLHGSLVQSHRPKFLWPHVRTSLSTPPPYIWVSVVNLTHLRSPPP